ncbi:MAG: anti-sigma factor [Solirubrobacteraceae bacterium]
MNPTQHHDCGADVAAYALHALDPVEAATFERHLEQCTICRDELTAFRSVIDALPMSVPAVTAPRKLKRRVMAAVTAEPTRTAAPAPRRAWLPQFSILSPRLGMALAGVVAAVVIAGALVLPGSGTSSRVVTAQVIGQSGSAKLRITDGHAELIVDHLAAPPAGKIYEVWLRRHGGPPIPTKALFSVTRSGAGDVEVPGDLGGVSAMMVTPEPAGGSPTPTHSPIIRAQLT